METSIDITGLKVSRNSTNPNDIITNYKSIRKDIIEDNKETYNYINDKDTKEIYQTKDHTLISTISHFDQEENKAKSDNEEVLVTEILENI